MKKDILEGFNFPDECPLGRQERDELLKKSRGHKKGFSPFVLCKRGKNFECPNKALLECFYLTEKKQKQSTPRLSQN